MWGKVLKHIKTFQTIPLFLLMSDVEIEKGSGLDVLDFDLFLRT